MPIDVIHLLNVLLLVLVIITLVILSIVHKFHDCEGFYSRCYQIEPESITLDSTDEGFSIKDTTSLIRLLTHKLAQVNQSKNFRFVKDTETLAGSNSNHNNNKNSFYTENNNTKQIDDNEKFLPKLEAFHYSLNRVWNYDWIGIDQYIILISLLFIIIFAFISAWFRNRSAIFASIILYLSHIIQLALIEISDDRDFPVKVFRSGKTFARYSLVYLDQTLFSLVLKSSLLILLQFEFILLIVCFVVVRYEKLISKLPIPT